MTHLPYIAAAYALTLGGVGGFALTAWLRMGRATRKLAAVDRRRA